MAHLFRFWITGFSLWNWLEPGGAACSYWWKSFGTHSHRVLHRRSPKQSLQGIPESHCLPVSVMTVHSCIHQPRIDVQFWLKPLRKFSLLFSCVQVISISDQSAARGPLGCLLDAQPRSFCPAAHQWPPCLSISTNQNRPSFASAPP